MQGSRSTESDEDAHAYIIRTVVVAFLMNNSKDVFLYVCLAICL